MNVGARQRTRPSSVSRREPCVTASLRDSRMGRLIIAIGSLLRPSSFFVLVLLETGSVFYTQRQKLKA